MCCLSCAVFAAVDRRGNAELVRRSGQFYADREPRFSRPPPARPARRLARQRSYQVRTTPLPAMTTMPASVQPSGKVPNTSQPAIVDQNELHVGERRDRGGRGELERPVNSQVADRTHDADAQEQCQVGLGYQSSS